MEKIALFIDRDNFVLSLKDRKLLKTKFLPIEKWKQLNSKMLAFLEFNASFIESIEDYIPHKNSEHIGSWLFVSQRVDLYNDTINSQEIKEEKEFLEQMKKIDSIFGFIIKYGIKYKASKQNNKLVEKGVDVQLVCQMLLGAFRNEYDSCILLSDEDEFIPAIEIIQNFYGKQVYHAGFEPDRLRAACFGNIPLEKEVFHQWLI